MTYLEKEIARVRRHRHAIEMIQSCEDGAELASSRIIQSLIDDAKETYEKHGHFEEFQQIADGVKRSTLRQLEYELSLSIVRDAGQP